MKPDVYKPSRPTRTKRAGQKPREVFSEPLLLIAESWSRAKNAISEGKAYLNVGLGFEWACFYVDLFFCLLTGAVCILEPSFLENDFLTLVSLEIHGFNQSSVAFNPFATEPYVPLFLVRCLPE